MGHTLPHLLKRWGGSLFSPKAASLHLIQILYLNRPVPSIPKSHKTPRKIDRNTELRQLYADGVSVPELAVRYGISQQRVHQILKG
jgi:Mor family transcriptional regulator